MPYVLHFSGREINGDSHQRYLDPLRGVAQRAGWRLSEVPKVLSVPSIGVRHALGLTNFQTNEIVLSTLLPSNMRVRVLAHELGHALVGRPDLVWPAVNEQAQIAWSETVAESIALRVCYGIGLDVIDVTTNYLHALPPVLVVAALNDEQARIHQTADRILREVSSTS